LVGARRSRFRLVLPFGKRYLVAFSLFALLFVAVGGVNMWPIFTVPCLFYALIASWLMGYVRGRLVIGADGLTTRWLIWERFVAFREVASVSGAPIWGGGGAVDTLLKLRTGRKVMLRTVEAPNTEADRGAEGRAMLAHVQESFAHSSTLLDGGADLSARLKRGSLSAREWLSALDALAEGGAARYRVAAVSPDALTDVARDPGASVEERVGAAAVLVRMGDEVHRTRVRVVAEGCAEPALRAALLGLVEARDEAATEAVLAKVARG
jgi:hypothetical protein